MNTPTASQQALAITDRSLAAVATFSDKHRNGKIPLIGRDYMVAPSAVVAVFDHDWNSRCRVIDGVPVPTIQVCTEGVFTLVDTNQADFVAHYNAVLADPEKISLYRSAICS